VASVLPGPVSQLAATKIPILPLEREFAGTLNICLTTFTVN